MTKEELGFTEAHQQYIQDHSLESYKIGRVTTEHKERYIVKTEEGEFDAEITGNLRFSAEDRSDFPAVGDWVACLVFDESLAIIHQILPRSTVLERQAVGKVGEKQIIATNIDVGFIVQAVDRDFNLNRLERYITVCHSAKVEPVIILNKTDLISPDERNSLVQEVTERIPEVPVLTISSQTGEGYDELKPFIQAGKTYCFLGSSGVGKSTLINYLTGGETMLTGSISDATAKGKHTTTHRELIVLESGGILIDNPGMREIGITDGGGGLEMTFDMIAQLAEECRFSDCTHLHEKGCAVLAAVETGKLDEAAYENFHKMQREQERFQSTVAEKRKRDKAMGKMYKAILNEKKKRKY